CRAAGRDTVPCSFSQPGVQFFSIVLRPRLCLFARPSADRVGDDMPLPLLALFLAAFAFGTTEFVVAGVLPQVAEGLGVSVPAAGTLVSAYALGIAFGGPVLTIATS